MIYMIINTHHNNVMSFTNFTNQLHFNFHLPFQVGNWVASCILQFDTVEERSEAIEQFITIAQVRHGNVEQMWEGPGGEAM